MGCEPRSVFSARNDAWQIRRADGALESSDHGALDQLDRWLEASGMAPGNGLVPAASGTAVRLAPTCAGTSVDSVELPFVGGAVGWLSYDLGRQFEALPVGRAVDDTNADDIRLAWHDAAVIWDHAAGTMWLVGIPGIRQADEAASELGRWLREPCTVFGTATFRAVGASVSDIRSGPVGAAQSDMPQPSYIAKVAEVREGIARGEYYQLNLVQRFTCAHTRHPAETYLRLREINPAPFSAYLSADDITVLSSSPERFIDVTPAGLIRTCPIKGTRPRGASEQQDIQNREGLLESAKERAELLMIVDLLRNDLGRVCVPGTVEVVRLNDVESFATVHHLVGEVRGQLRPGLSRRELLRAVFPGGSITGAPKVSAMRAIDQLEPHRRGIAMGSIGYFSAHGRMDLNIAIRTIVVRGGVAHIAVGAGIVWDSDPAAEYAETLTKARAQFAALGIREIVQ